MENMNEYARRGDIEGLYSSIQADPQLLHDIDDVQFINTPLHEAAAAGQTHFALEILYLMPSFGKKLNLQGLSPLHVALENGKTTTVRSIVKIDKQLVRVKGKEGFTPLHFAVKIADKGTTDEILEILADFLFECPEAIFDLNNRLQTAVHVALEYSDKEEVSVLLLNWLARTSRESVLGLKDVDGNTAFHAAVKFHRVKAVKVILMKHLVKLNTKNMNDETPLDIAQPYDTEMTKMLIQAGALRGSQLPKIEKKGQYLRSPVCYREDIFRGLYLKYKNFVSQIRSDVMVVAILITTATYQAVLQPPGGASKAADSDDAEGYKYLDSIYYYKHQTMSGVQMSMVEKRHYNFMTANTVAFSLSIALILMSLHGRYLLLFVSLICLAYSYITALNIITNPSEALKVLFWAVFVTALSIKMSYMFVDPVIHDVWWIPRSKTMFSNCIHRVPVGRWLQNKFPIVRKLIRQYQLIKY